MKANVVRCDGNACAMDYMPCHPRNPMNVLWCICCAPVSHQIKNDITSTRNYSDSNRASSSRPSSLIYIHMKVVRSISIHFTLAPLFNSGKVGRISMRNMAGFGNFQLHPFKSNAKFGINFLRKLSIEAVHR